ncbi:integral membrane protein [Rutstroemia sp. NJR-2017a WRK4]|nr:integral membrane protein [Rutstroemia sp. NJR-2017a WRK4]
MSDNPHTHFDATHHDDEIAFGPFKFLNPTTRRVPLEYARNNVKGGTTTTQENGKEVVGKTGLGNAGDVRAADVHRKWRSRDNRKGRHAISVKPSAAHTVPRSTSTPRAVLRGILRMFTSYPYYDVSYLVAAIFTIGSVVWVINAFFVWLPLEKPSTEFSGEIEDAGGITAFIGATIFEIGSVFLMLEAINEDRTGCFGWAVEEVWEEEEGRLGMKLEKGNCRHHHGNKRNLVGKGKEVEDGKTSTDPTAARSWQWWPSMHALRTQYLHNIGFLACSFQMLGATIFWIAGFTALPPIFNRLTSTAAQNGAYWLPQVIGGTGFIISGALFMLETQKKWWLPAWGTLGWHIGAWNLIGGIGFTLCGALGFGSANSGVAYEASLATFWGSWCFLIGSVIQWYESLEKYPVEVEDFGSKDVKNGGEK